jgi:hypothetical protein
MQRFSIAPRACGLSLGVLTALMLLPGCGGGPRLHHISGEVLFDGKPVPAGEIFFDPDASKQHDGPQGFARIENGRFDTRQGGIAVAPGPHVVRILGFDGRSRPEAELIFGRQLFPEHHVPTDIPDRETTLNFQIPARGPSR